MPKKVSKKKASSHKELLKKFSKEVHPLTGMRTCPFVDIPEKRCMAGAECPIGYSNIKKKCHNLPPASYAKVRYAAGGVAGWL